jgi:tetratricopeptide (TPR) repeat protein
MFFCLYAVGVDVTFSPAKPKETKQVSKKTNMGKGKKVDTVELLYSEGKDCFRKKDYKSALQKWNQALSIEKQKTQPRRKRLTILYYNLGRVSFNEGEYKIARKKFETALSYFQKNDYDDNFPILLYNELSNTYQYTEQYKKGLKYALLTLKLQKNKYGENDVWTGAYFVGAAVMYHKLQNKPMAIKYMRKAVDIFKKFPDKKRETERLTRHLKKWYSDQ